MELKSASDRRLVALHRREARRVSTALTRSALAAVKAWRASSERGRLVSDAEDVIRDAEVSGAIAFARSYVLNASFALRTSQDFMAAIMLLGEQVTKTSMREAILQMRASGADVGQLQRLFRSTVSTYTATPEGVSASVIGIDVAPTASAQATLEGWASQNVSLIRTYMPDALDGIDKVLAQHIRGGARWGTLAGELQKRPGMSERHAVLVARDQTSKLQSAITNDMHRQAGITHYRWRTAKDSRVRDEHRVLEGQIFETAGPGAPGAGPYGQPAHPGEGIQCRCYREPIVSDVPSLRRPAREGFPVVPDLVRPVTTTGTVPPAIRPVGGRAGWAVS